MQLICPKCGFPLTQRFPNCPSCGIALKYPEESGEHIYNIDSQIYSQYNNDYNNGHNRMNNGLSQEMMYSQQQQRLQDTQYQQNILGYQQIIQQQKVQIEQLQNEISRLLSVVQQEDQYEDNSGKKTRNNKSIEKTKQRIPGIPELFKKKKILWAAIIVIVVLFLITFLIAIFSDDSPTIESNQGVDQSYHEPAEDDSNTEVESTLLSEGLSMFTAGDYPYITNSDLSQFAANMIGKDIYTVGEIRGFSEGNIQLSLDDQLMLSTFRGDNDYSNELTVGDIVAVYGTIAEVNDGGFMGHSVYFDNCMAFAVGEDAENYSGESTDESLNSYLTVTEEVAKTSGVEISEDDYKALCEYRDHEDIIRNPDLYEGQYTIVSGKVSQVIQGLFNTYTFYIEDSSGNRWECSYMYKEGESRLMENDTVTVYGICKGTSTSTTVLGKQMILPSITLDYIN